MKQIHVLLAILLIGGLLVTGCGSKDNNAAKPAAKQELTIPVSTATPQLLENIKFVLNKNWEIVDTTKVYVTKSKDFENAYFIGTLVKNGSQIYNCIWFSNSSKMDGMTMSANDYAIQASSLPDARTSSVAITQADDGYSRINQRLLSDWNNLK